MYVLQQAVFDVLNTVPELAGKLFYFVAPIDTPPPYVEFWTGDGAPDSEAGFGEEGRDYGIYVQASSRNGQEAQRLYDAAHEVLGYTRLDVVGWNQRGKVHWLHELDDPGDTTQDDDLIYYTGGCFRIQLFRQRTN